jgi:hypothetical protein
MMKASINGGAPRDLDDTVASCLTLDAASEASGRIRDGAAVARAHLWRSLREGWLIFDVSMVAGLIFLAWAAVPRAKPWEVLLVIAFAAYAAIRVAIRTAHSMEWSRGIAQRLAALPSSGTLVQVADESGLTVGTTQTPWDELRMEAVALRMFSIPTNFDRTRYRVDGMTLATRGGSVVLDPIAIERGQTIVDTIWRRLVAWPQPPRAM